MIKVIFVDIDDTLLSFSGYVKSAMRDGFARFGIAEYKEEMFPVFEEINGHLWRQIERGEITFDELQEIRWNRIFAALGLDFDGVLFEKYFRDYLFDSAIPIDGAMDMLEYLYPKYTLCAASNGPYGQQINRLKVAGMYKYFLDCFISEKAGAQKPTAAFFDYCFGRLRHHGVEGLKPSEVMIIGDSLTSDMAGGAAYGMKTCLLAAEPLPEADMAGIDHVIRDLRQVSEIL